MKDCTTDAECLVIDRKGEREEDDKLGIGSHKLQLSIKQCDRLLESLPDAMVILSSAGKIVHINAQMEQVFGYAKDELIGRNLEILMPERFRARHRNNVSGFISHPRIRPMGTGLELYGLKKDGTEFPADISLSYFTADGETLAMAAIRDITDRKNVEHRIELNYQIQKAISSVLKISLEPISLEEQINRVLDLILTVPSFAIHSRGSIHLVETETARLELKAMHGFSVAQVAACKTVPFGKDRPSASTSTCSIIDIDCLDEHREIQYTVQGLSGQYCVPIVLGEKALGLINVAVMDGHKRVPEEEEFLSAIASSLAGLIERHQSEREKERLREQLVESEKLAALGRITANVSHTIKNPLTAIGGFANRLLDKLPEGTKEKKYAGLIFSEAIRLENVLQNVLLFSRRDADRRDECNLSEIAGKALTMYEDICREKSIAVNRLFKDVPVVNANKEQVLQAIENLLSNAIDAMPGGGSLTVITNQEKVAGALYATVKITDTGHGMEPEKISRIFEPFFTTKLLTKGTGLGLSITKKVVDDHGGLIHVDSAVGAGTTFSLYFPYKPK